MKAEYLSQLEDILKLRREDDTVRKHSSLTIKSIENISQTLLTDHVLINNFVGVAEETASSVSLIDHYSHTSLDEVNDRFLEQFHKIKSIWDDFTTIEAYLTSQELFRGLADKLKENKERYSTSRNIAEVEKHHKLVAELLNEKKNLEKLADDYSIIKKYLENQKLFTGLLNSFKDNEEKCRASSNMGDVKKHHKLVAKLLNKKTNLEKVVKDIQELTGILDDLPVFKGLISAFQEHRRGIIKAKTVDTINSHHAWVAELLKNKSKLGYIDREINNFKIFISNNSFFKQHKWIALLENKCANAKESTEIQQLHTNTKKRRQLLDAVEKLSKNWDELNQYCHQNYGSEVATKNCGKDKEDIVKELSLQEDKSRLDDHKVMIIKDQLDRKLKHIKGVVDRSYPSIDYESYPDFWEGVFNVIFFIINVFLFIFVWPIIFMSRSSDKSSSIEKSVLEW